MEKRFNRILLKLRGEALMGSQEYGIDPERIRQYAEDVKTIHDQGYEVAIVIGGGNIFRGLQAEGSGIERAQGDYMGMLATVINGIALQSAMENSGMTTRLLTAIKMDEVAEPYIRRRAIRHLERGRVVIFGAGTGNPFFTTDTTAALRAVEINADVILKGTRVDGVYSADPEKHADATRYDSLTFKEAMGKGLKVMDLTAFALCEENGVPIVVFDMNKKGNLARVLQEQGVGTLVTR